MTRVLLVETASPKRIRKTAEVILAGGVYPEPEITILCTADPATLQYFSEIRGVQVVSLPKKKSRSVLAKLRLEHFEVMRTFWTGEKKYRAMKLLAFGLGARFTDVDIGDGGVFRLTWKFILKFWFFRLKHPLPSDTYEYVLRSKAPEESRPYQGHRILIIQSAEPPYVFRALDRLREKQLFRNPRYTIFCRNRPEIVARCKQHPMIFETRTHTESRGFWLHLRELRKERFDGLVVFFTGDPSYWKIKYFAFILGVRHKVIFNESNDCFLFTWGAWFSLLVHRLGEQSRVGVGPLWFYQVRILFYFMVKLVVFPFRFAWLLLVWLKLRMAS